MRHDEEGVAATRIAIIVGSTRPGRRALTVAEWVRGEAERLRRAGELDAEVEIVDLATVGLPMLDEPVPAIVGEYAGEHTRRWSGIVEGFDGFVFVVPEYNHSFPAAVKNAVDYLFSEWNNKAAGFVGYGLQGGQRAVEQLRLVLAEVSVATVRSQVGLTMAGDFDDDPVACAPCELQHELLRRTLREVSAWAGALRTLRAGVPA